MEETHEEVEMAGGLHDGRRLCVVAGTSDCTFPVRPVVDMKTSLDPGLSREVLDPPVLKYRWDGKSYSSDGLRVFHAAG